ncbi:nucleotidyltransferase domain-containing protein [bacterium]|nr:nucleotidyltransferase domain-containing protein [bacterium]MBU1486849.1 nucleotidyltransferase domain-containing protein [bacterium]
MKEKEMAIMQKLKNLVSMKTKVWELKAFGSRVKGNATEESDFDVLVVVDSAGYEIEKYISECAWESGFPEDVVVMPIVLTKDMLQNTPLKESVFVKNAYWQGVSV